MLKGIRKGNYIITDSDYHYPQFKGMVLKVLDVITCADIFTVYSPLIGYFSVNAKTFRKATKNEVENLYAVSN